jgi:hypothetical protein
MRVSEIIGVYQSRSLWPSFLPCVRNRHAQSHTFIRFGRQNRWVWTILVVLVSVRSYFVRELISVLVLFTILFVILAFLVSPFVLMGHVFYCTFFWAESVVRSFQSFVHQPLALPAREPTLVSDPANGGRKLDHG